VAGAGAGVAAGVAEHPAKHPGYPIEAQATQSRKGESQAPEAQVAAQLSTAPQTRAVISPHGVLPETLEAHDVLH
jgi:hypothetical protein